LYTQVPEELLGLLPDKAEWFADDRAKKVFAHNTSVA
jgi:hypothetical protein